MTCDVVASLRQLRRGILKDVPERPLNYIGYAWAECIRAVCKEF